MFADERYNLILTELREKDRVTVDSLVELLNVSKATVRKDLNYLDSRGLLVRTRGGAVTQKQFVFAGPSSLTSHRGVHAAEKERIGRAVVDLVEDGDMLMIDAGTTTLCAAKHLARSDKRLTVITNSVEISMEMNKPNCNIQVFLTGGLLQKDDNLLQGPEAEDLLQRLNGNKAIIGAMGLTLKHGLTDPNLPLARIKRLMAERCEELIVVLDSSKIGGFALAPVVPITMIDVLVTDAGISEEARHGLEEAGVKVVVAE